MSYITNNMHEIKNGVKKPKLLKRLHIRLTHKKHKVGSVALNWQPLDLNNIFSKLTSQRFQDGSYSCTWQATASGGEVFTKVPLTASGYADRPSNPDLGDYLVDPLNVLCNTGFGTEADYPSQNQNEAQMDVKKNIVPKYKGTGKTLVDIKDIDQIAEAIEGFGQCEVTYSSNSSEYNQFTPQGFNIPAFNGQPTTFGHEICGQVYGLLIGVPNIPDDTKAIVCRDSDVRLGVTIITEDFHSKRNTGAGYINGVIDIQATINNLKQEITILQQLILAWTKLKQLLGQ